MPKKINIQVGLFLMLLLVLSSGGCGNSKDDKGKASTPAARKANMEKALKGPAGIALREKILETLKKGAKRAPANASMDEAQIEAMVAQIFDKQIAAVLVEQISLKEKITLADVQNGIDVIEASLGGSTQGIPDDMRQDLQTNYKELVHLLVKAHGGLQKK